ncbi:MAG TPA: transcriptional repressor [Firmicutes bacterium]|nr:transcriptional repressor [Bacillota bacterium]
MVSQNLAAVLSAHGVRPTQQRIAVYDYLLTHHTHPSADTIYNALSKKYPVFSRTTIYNSLNTLVQARLIRTVNISPEEQRFDGNVCDHGHFRCAACGEIFDFAVDPAVLHSLCPAGFQGEQGDLFFTGYCPQCLSLSCEETAG